ncbi:MAG: LON peptidase substrate-binding domain-containing protein [Pirellulales bacterium]
MLPWHAEDLTFDEGRFTGKVRLFPLPDLVMFPHVMQPLHIHEPRYRELLSEALDHDGLIAMSILSPGWEANYEDQPPIHSTACLGKIITHQRQEDGQYNVLMLGMRRVHIECEVSSVKAFRQAEVRVLDDYYEQEGSDEREALQIALAQMFQEQLPDNCLPPGAVREALSSEVPLSVLTDLVSFAMPLSLEVKCALLGQPDVDRRAWMLLDSIETMASDSKNSTTLQQPGPKGFFPPPFSLN